MSIIKKVDGKEIDFTKQPIIEHNKLEGRDNYGAHSISAIRKLPEKLSNLKKRLEDLESVASVSADFVKEQDRINKREIEEKAKQINISTSEENENELLFTNYDGNTTTFRSGHEVDDKSIELKDEKLTVKRIYTTSNLEGLGTEESPLNVKIDNNTIIETDSGIQSTSLLTNTDTISGQSIMDNFNSINNNITQLDDDITGLETTFTSEIVNLEDQITNINTKDANQDVKITNLESLTKGNGGYLNAAELGENVTQDTLTNYALQEIGIEDKLKIFNSTRVKNLTDNHLWVLTNTPDSDPAVFEWSDQGIDTVSIATVDTLGIVKSSNNDLEGNIDDLGKITINGLSEKLESLEDEDISLQLSISSLNESINNSISEMLTNINASLETKASTSESNNFTSTNTFNEETLFNEVVEHYADVNITDAVVKISDTAENIVTQYAADEIVIEKNETINNIKFPDKSGIIALDSDIEKYTVFDSEDDPIDLTTLDVGKYMFKGGSFYFISTGPDIFGEDSFKVEFTPTKNNVGVYGYPIVEVTRVDDDTVSFPAWYARISNVAIVPSGITMDTKDTVLGYIKDIDSGTGTYILIGLITYDESNKHQGVIMAATNTPMFVDPSYIVQPADWEGAGYTNGVLIRLSDEKTGYTETGFAPLEEIYPNLVTSNITIDQPASATSGTLTEEQLTILQSGNSSYILFNSEKYDLQDIQHESGYLTFTHKGTDSTGNFFTKCITVTISTSGWVLTTQTDEDTPTENSKNLITSGGVYTSLETKANANADNIDYSSFAEKLNIEQAFETGETDTDVKIIKFGNIVMQSKTMSISANSTETFTFEIPYDNDNVMCWCNSFDSSDNPTLSAVVISHSDSMTVKATIDSTVTMYAIGWKAN